MRWYRAFQMSDDGKTVTMKSGVAFGMGGVSATYPNSLVAGGIGSPSYFTSAGVSGETYGRYNKLASTGAGTGEFIAGRDRTVLSAIVSNAHGVHDSLEISSTGRVSGLGTAIRGNIVITDTAVAAGTYYGVLAEIYSAGNTSALPTASNACLGINLQPGTAIDLVGNAISFSGTDGSGKMIYTHAITMGATGAGGIRVLVNGVKRWIPFVAAE
jgi:hypothetical protein